MARRRNAARLSRCHLALSFWTSAQLWLLVPAPEKRHPTGTRAISRQGRSGNVKTLGAGVYWKPLVGIYHRSIGLDTTVPSPITQPPAERGPPPPRGEGSYSRRQREPLRTTPCPQADNAISTWLSAGGARESVADGLEVLSGIRSRA